MKNSKRHLTCAQAKENDMVDYLANKGFQPAKIKGNNFWYRSPLRQENTASFKVNRKLNRWYDFGIGKGGDLVDFAILFTNCTIAEFVQSFDSNLSFHKPGFFKPTYTNDTIYGAIKIISSKPLHSLALLRYLKSRNIPLVIAEKYCREIDFELYNKAYFSIGLLNDAGGYEMRNQWCKNSSTPKGITTIKIGAKKVAVFEGFFDFLSFLVLLQSDEIFHWDFCILNSLSFFEKAQTFLMKHNSIHLFLDNDAAGKNYCASALIKSEKYTDESGLYKGYKDLNQWITLVGKQPLFNITEPPC